MVSFGSALEWRCSNPLLVFSFFRFLFSHFVNKGTSTLIIKGSRVEGLVAIATRLYLFLIEHAQMLRTLARAALGSLAVKQGVEEANTGSVLLK